MYWLRYWWDRISMAEQWTYSFDWRAAGEGRYQGGPTSYGVAKLMCKREHNAVLIYHPKPRVAKVRPPKTRELHAGEPPDLDDLKRLLEKR